MYPLVEVSGLVNRFGTQVVHEGLDMVVNRDEVFGIVGGSGTGKSVRCATILGCSARRPAWCASMARTSPRCRLQLRYVRSRYVEPVGALYSALTVMENAPPMVSTCSPMHSLDELALLKIRLVGLADAGLSTRRAWWHAWAVKRVALARALRARPEPAVPR
jgi:phospholipid/cholesterol/gamma-HCH transport system ATP-binding protein